jgi:hypothetical protein
MADPSVDSSSPPSSDTECYRAELDNFVKQFESAPQVVQSDVDEARFAIASADADSLELMYRSLSANPNWRALPAVMASVAQGQQDWQRQELARILSESLTPPVASEQEDPELTRGSLLQVVDQMRRFAPIVTDPSYEANLASLEERIKTMDAAMIPRAREIFAARTGEFRQKLSAMTESSQPFGSMVRSEGPIASMAFCDDFCEDDPTGICDDICEGIASAINAVTNAFVSFISGPITDIINKIVSIGTTIANTFTGLFDRVKLFFTEALDALIALIPASPGDVFNAIIPAAAKGVEALKSAIASVPQIPELCPPDNVLAIAEDVCGRGGDEVTGLLVKLAPGDTVGVAAKIPLVLLDAGLRYLCLCADHKSAQEFDDAQADHRDLTEDNLDQKLSILATQANVTILNASLATLDGDVAAVEGKLDSLGQDVGDITATLLDDKVFIESFKKLMTRINIEENLLENKPNAVSLFQLPENYGGMLGLVRSIAWDTFHMNESAGQPTNGAFRELGRGDSYFTAGSFAAAYEAYRSAYTEAVK